MTVPDEFSGRIARGDVVVVRRAFPPGHIRTPFYTRGRKGLVVKCLGSFANPEELAFRRSGLPTKLLYRVRFAQHELWSDYIGPVHDTVEVDLYEHWLEPVPPKDGE